MKKISLLISMICLMMASLQISSCSKKEDEKPKLSFTINGVSDQTLNGGALTLPLTIGYTSGPQEPVNLSISGLPSGITSSFSSQSGTPSFSSTLTLTPAAAVTAGDYTVTVTGTTVSGVVKSAAFKLTVPDDCANGMTGMYKYSFVYDGSEWASGFYQATKSTSQPKTLKFVDVSFPSDSMIVVLDCSKMTCFDDMGNSGVFSYTPKKLTFNISDKETLTLTAQ